MSDHPSAKTNAAVVDVSSHDAGSGPREGGSDKPDMSQLVFEYLELNGLDKTLATFIEECRNRSRSNGGSLPFPDQGTQLPFSSRGASKILICFDRGDLSGFLKLWNAFLLHIQPENQDLKKMEVYLRVYFAVYPFTHGRSESQCDAAMQQLRTYFEDKTNNFSRELKALPMFALPYTAEALEKPEFHELIEVDWADKLRYQLETTIFRYFHMVRENMEAQTTQSGVLRLELARRKEQKQAAASADALSHAAVSDHYQKQFNLLTKTFRKVRRLLRGTRESYGRLLKVAFELICGLESSASASKTGGRTAAVLEPVIQNCYEIFPELFTSEGTPKGVPDTEYFKHLAADAFFDSVIDSDVSLFFIGISDMSPELLDYAKIKETLGSEDMTHRNSNKLCLLQALRWLLTRSPNSCKNYAMDSFIAFDLLGLGASEANSNYRRALFACMTSRTPTYLRECLIRFINCCASMRAGRKYLSSTNFIVDTLTLALKTFDVHAEKYNCQMIIAAFQKLSLRKVMRLRMIENGVVQWVTNYMRPEVMKIEIYERLPAINGASLSPRSVNAARQNYNPYLMEFGWALIMNLCLHEEAQAPSAQVGKDLIGCTLKMLRIKSAQDVMPYIVSTLYNLVQNKLTCPLAVEMGVAAELGDIMARGIDSVDEALLESIVRILKGVEREGDRHTGEINYDDDQEEYEELEPQIEVPETWVKALDTGAIVGDELLSQKYLIKRTSPPPAPVLPDYNGNTNGNDGSLSSRSIKKEVIMRPMTPSMMKKMAPSSQSPPHSHRTKKSQPQLAQPHYVYVPVPQAGLGSTPEAHTYPHPYAYAYEPQPQSQVPYQYEAYNMVREPSFDRNNNDYPSMHPYKAKPWPPEHHYHQHEMQPLTSSGNPFLEPAPVPARQKVGYPMAGHGKVRRKKAAGIGAGLSVANNSGEVEVPTLPVAAADQTNPASLVASKKKKKLKPHPAVTAPENPKPPKDETSNLPKVSVSATNTQPKSTKQRQDDGKTQPSVVKKGKPHKRSKSKGAT